MTTLADIEAAETAFQCFVREMREGFHFLRGHPSVILLGTSWALFLGAMLTAVVVTAPRVGGTTVKGAFTGSLCHGKYHRYQQFSSIECPDLATIMTL